MPYPAIKYNISFVILFSKWLYNEVIKNGLKCETKLISILKKKKQNSLYKTLVDMVLVLSYGNSHFTLNIKTKLTKNMFFSKIKIIGISGLSSY